METTKIDELLIALNSSSNNMRNKIHLNNECWKILELIKKCKEYQFETIEQQLNNEFKRNREAYEILGRD